MSKYIMFKIKLNITMKKYQININTIKQFKIKLFDKDIFSYYYTLNPNNIIATCTMIGSNFL